MQDQETMASLAKAKDDWERMTLRDVLTKWPERYEEFITTSGAPVERLYTPLDIVGLDYERDLGFHPWRTSHDVQGSVVDDAHVRGIWQC